MNRRRSKISGYKQNKLLGLFVGGVTARAAAALTGINRHTATLYYQKIRAMIAQAIEDETPFDGEIEIDESYLGASEKANKGVARRGKFRSLACSSAAAKSMPKSFPTLPARPCCPLSPLK